LYLAAALEEQQEQARDVALDHVAAIPTARRAALTPPSPLSPSLARAERMARAYPREKVHWCALIPLGAGCLER
jgi:hypothetical protein